MPYRKNNLGIGSFYHVFNRGANRHKIFYDSENYNYFLRLLKAHSSQQQIGVVTYCLMPNHFHLLIYQETERSISKFIQGLLSAYTQAVNKQQNRNGTLFEGRFKHILIDKQSYLLQLNIYIHFNPVKSNLVLHPLDWEYSDYRYWTEETGNFPKVEEQKLHSNFRKDQTMNDWNIDRVQQFRDMLGIPENIEYKNLMMEYKETIKENREIEKYLFD
jgi:putative transposase